MTNADDVDEDDGDPTGLASSAVQPDVGALYKSYLTAMRHSATKIFGPRAVSSDVDEAISMVVANLVNAHAKGTLRQKDNWEPYLRQSARNAALSVVKDRAKNASLDAATDGADGTEKFDARTQPADPVAEEIIKKAERQDAQETVARAELTDRERDILDAYFAKGMTNEAIGKLYGVSGQAISKTRRGAQRKLKQLLEGGETT